MLSTSNVEITNVTQDGFEKCSYTASTLVSFYGFIPKTLSSWEIHFAMKNSWCLSKQFLFPNVVHKLLSLKKTFWFFFLYLENLLENKFGNDRSWMVTDAPRRDLVWSLVPLEKGQTLWGKQKKKLGCLRILKKLSKPWGAP